MDNKADHSQAASLRPTSQQKASTSTEDELSKQFEGTSLENSEQQSKTELMEKIINFFKKALKISKKDVKPLEVAKACVGPNANKSSVNKYLEPLHRAEIISKTFFKITKDSQSDPRYNALPEIEEITEKKIIELAAKVNSGSKQEKKSLDQPVVTDNEMSPCKNESAASKIAGPEDTTRSVPTAHAPAYPFSKGTHNQKDVLSSIARAEVSKSVGLIHIDGQPVGTGFRVGEKYLVTCIHVIRNVIKVKPHMLDGQRLTIEFYRITYNQKENELLIFSFQPLIAYFDEEYDFVVLELRSHDAGVPFPPALNFFADVFDSEIHLVGHPGGRQMKEDSIKPRWSPDHDEEIIPYINYLALWSKSHFPDKRDYYSILLEPPRKIIFHTTFDTGSSGSPGVMIRDNRPCVVVMVRGGTPSCFYENRYPHLPVEDDHKVEYGYAMSDIYHKMLKSTNQNVKDLASEIFGEWI